MKSLLERTLVNAKSLREIRVRNTIDITANASTTYLLNIKQTLLNHISKIERLLDFGATSTTDIASNLRHFEADKWVKGFYKNINEVIDGVYKYNTKVRMHNALFPEHKLEEVGMKNLGSICPIIFSEDDKNVNTGSD